MDIVDGAKKVCFLASVSGRHNKFVNEVQQVSFNGQRALEKGTEVYLATEFYLLQLSRDGWKVIEMDDSQEATEALGKIPFELSKGSEK